MGTQTYYRPSLFMMRISGITDVCWEVFVCNHVPHCLNVKHNQFVWNIHAHVFTKFTTSESELNKVMHQKLIEPNVIWLFTINCHL